MLLAGAGMAQKRAGNADGAMSPSLGMLVPYLPAGVLPQSPSKVPPLPFVCRNWASWDLGITESLKVGKDLQRA